MIINNSTEQKATCNAQDNAQVYYTNAHQGKITIRAMRMFAKRHLEAGYGCFGSADAFREKYGVDTSRYVVGFNHSLYYPERELNEIFCEILDEVETEMAEDF